VRKIPEFLPPTIQVFNNRYANVLGGAVGVGTNIVDTSHVVAPTQMELLMYQSPALIHGLLMTQVKMADGDVQCFFFGYRCVACETVYLVHNRIRQAEDLYEFSIHQCDPSEIRRAVRNARHLGLDRGEEIMEGFNGKWWPETRRKEDIWLNGISAGSAAVSSCLPNATIQDSGQ
jgi:hypothetical protein